MMGINQSKDAFEKDLENKGLISSVYNLNLCTVFDTEKNEYFASDTSKRSEDKLVDFINYSWGLWQISVIEIDCDKRTILDLAEKLNVAKSTGSLMLLDNKELRISSDWTHVEEKEPDLGETVLVCWDYMPDVEPEKDFMESDVDTGNHYWANCEKEPPTHWMAIPKVPRLEVKSND